MSPGTIVTVILRCLPGAIDLLVRWLRARQDAKVQRDVKEFKRAVATDDTAALEQLLSRL